MISTRAPHFARYTGPDLDIPSGALVVVVRSCGSESTIAYNPLNIDEEGIWGCATHDLEPVRAVWWDGTFDGGTRILEEEGIGGVVDRVRGDATLVVYEAMAGLCPVQPGEHIIIGQNGNAWPESLGAPMSLFTAASYNPGGWGVWLAAISEWVYDPEAHGDLSKPAAERLAVLYCRRYPTVGDYEDGVTEEHIGWCEGAAEASVASDTDWVEPHRLLAVKAAALMRRHGYAITVALECAADDLMDNTDTWGCWPAATIRDSYGDVWDAAAELVPQLLAKASHPTTTQKDAQKGTQRGDRDAVVK